MPLKLNENYMPGEIIQVKIKIYCEDATLWTMLDCTCLLNLPQLSQIIRKLLTINLAAGKPCSERDHNTLGKLSLGHHDTH